MEDPGALPTRPPGGPPMAHAKRAQVSCFWIFHRGPRMDPKLYPGGIPGVLPGSPLGALLVVPGPRLKLYLVSLSLNPSAD